MKKIASALVLVLAAAQLHAGTLLQQNFDGAEFKAGPLSTGKAKEAQGGTWKVLCGKPAEFSIVSDDAASAPNALKVLRQTGAGHVAFKIAPQSGYDFVTEFKCKLRAKNGVVVHFANAKATKPQGGILLIGGDFPKAYNSRMIWQRAANIPALPVNEYFTCRAAFDANRQCYTVTIITKDGKSATSDTVFPFLDKKPVQEIRFINIQPQGSYSLIDDLVVTETAAPVIPTSGVLLKQNFDGAQFKAGALKSGASKDGAGGIWKINCGKPEEFSIVSDDAASAPNALKVLRQTGAGHAAFHIKAVEGYDFTVEFKCKVKAGNGVVIHFANAKSPKPLGGVLLQAHNAPKGYSLQMGWQKAEGLSAIPGNEWFTCRVSFDATNQNYKLTLVTKDGKSATSTNSFPFLDKKPVQEIRFINILPKGCYSLIDDIIVTQAEKPALTGRTLLNGSASSVDVAINRLLKGESGAEAAIAAHKPVEIEFSPEADFNAMQIAFKDKKKISVSIRALNSLGHWNTVCTGKTFDDQGFLIVPKAAKVVKLSFDFSAAATLTSFACYSPLSAAQGDLDAAWEKKIDAEYRLPVYDLQYPSHKKAQFTLVNHTKGTLKVNISLLERNTKQAFGDSRTMELPPGNSDIYFDLTTMPNGEYLTTVSDASVSGTQKAGKLQRLLRLRTSPACAAVPRKDMSGEKMFFPDGFYLEKYDGIDFNPIVAERYLAKRSTPQENDHFIVMGDELFLDEKGRICINYRTMNRKWETASTQHYHTIALDDSLTKWEDHQGTMKKTVSTPNPLKGRVPAAARPDWNPKPGQNGKINYHFYDAAKDGKIKLNQVNLVWISTSEPGTLGYQKYDWGVLNPAPCTVWPVWYKAPGEAVILSKKPLVDTFPPSGSLEPPNSGSDLGFGQWLSDDGKTLFVGRGRHLMRSMPYVARYDNLFDRARISAVWRTQDGLHWEQNYIAPPTDNKPIADQQYGGRDLRMPDGAGLHISFLLRYSAYTQQISWELIYSWDGFRWTRYQDKPQFMANGPLGDWTHCGGYLSTQSVEKNGKIYQLMYWINDHYHFQSEIVHSSINDCSVFTAEYMKKRYSPRHLEEWPLFKKHFNNSWEKLAEHTRNATSSVGVAVYRKDGFFSADAGEKTAHLLTVPFKAKGGMILNAVVAKNGFMEIRLLQNGKEVPGYTKRLTEMDDTALKLFDKLPEGPFQVALTMKNARLYTFHFPVK